jgi:hypothetical protein
MRTRNRSGAVDLRALAGVIAAGLLLGGVASVTMHSGTAEAAANDKAKSAGEAKAPAAGGEAAPTAKVTAKTPVATTSAAAKPAATASAAAKPAVTTSVAAKPARSAKAAAPVAKTGVAPVAGAVVVTPARVEQSLAYQYNTLGRRDPFQSLLSGEYVGSDLGGDAPPDLGGLKVVGIVWGDSDQFALVEDARGDSHILRRGDKVMNGFVENLLRDAMVVALTVDGQTQSVKVPITRKGEHSNANR